MKTLPAVWSDKLIVGASVTPIFEKPLGNTVLYVLATDLLSRVHKYYDDIPTLALRQQSYILDIARLSTAHITILHRIDCVPGFARFFVGDLHCTAYCTILHNKQRRFLPLLLSIGRKYWNVLCWKQIYGTPWPLKCLNSSSSSSECISKPDYLESYPMKTQWHRFSSVAWRWSIFWHNRRRHFSTGRIS